MNFWDAFFANDGGNDLAEINLQSRVDLTPLLTPLLTPFLVNCMEIVSWGLSHF